MALLLETTLGDLVIDLDVDGSPELCKNVLKLAKARYYTSTLVYNIDPNRFCQLGDPRGDGAGGTCIYGLIAACLKLQQQQEEVDNNDNERKRNNNNNNNNNNHNNNNDLQTAISQSTQRFLKSSKGRCLTAAECQEKGRVVATEMSGIPDTIGSQFLITTAEGPDMALDNYFSPSSSSETQQQQGGGGTGGESSGVGQQFRSLGIVSEDKNNILDKLNETYCDSGGRPYADVRIIRALVIDDPFDDPPNFDHLLKMRGVIVTTTNHNGNNEHDENENDDKVIASPEYECPIEEVVEKRISADQIDPLQDEEDIQKIKEIEEKSLQRQDKSRATVLEMLGDLPSADATAPENVLFVCKLNSITEDEDLELIFSRFDEQVKAEIIRDADTGNSLQYAFVEFSSKNQAVEAYFKMNNALVDDRRIKVDFSQSVAKVWDRYNQKMRMSRLPENSGNNTYNNNNNGPGRPAAGRGPNRRNYDSFGRGGRGRGGVNDDFRQRNNNDRLDYGHNTVNNNSRESGVGGGGRGDRRWGAPLAQRNDRQDRNQPPQEPRSTQGGNISRSNERLREDHHILDDGSRQDGKRRKGSPSPPSRKRDRSRSDDEEHYRSRRHRSSRRRSRNDSPSSSSSSRSRSARQRRRHRSSGSRSRRRDSSYSPSHSKRRGRKSSGYHSDSKERERKRHSPSRSSSRESSRRSRSKEGTSSRRASTSSRRHHHHHHHTEGKARAQPTTETKERKRLDESVVEKQSSSPQHRSSHKRHRKDREEKDRRRDDRDGGSVDHHHHHHHKSSRDRRHGSSKDQRQERLQGPEHR